MDHSSWGTAHTVWGRVADDASMQVAEAIVRDSPYHNVTHPAYGTVMRMMDAEVKFTPHAVPLPDNATAEAHEL